MNMTNIDTQESEREAEMLRNAYNTAFAELGLLWSWDRETHRSLQKFADERQRVLAYLEAQQAHLLTAYEPQFLVDAIHSTMQKYRSQAQA